MYWSSAQDQHEVVTEGIVVLVHGQSTVPLGDSSKRRSTAWLHRVCSRACMKLCISCWLKQTSMQFWSAAQLAPFGGVQEFNQGVWMVG